MNKTTKLLTISIIAFLIGSFFSVAMAADDFTNDGNDRKGKYLYKKNCRTCHDGSSAAVLSPNSKTQAQWQRSFAKYERLDCIEEWKKRSPKDLTDIYTYLYNHGYDSPQPATCQ
jgi:hypothetical protein